MSKKTVQLACSVYQNFLDLHQTYRIMQEYGALAAKSRCAFRKHSPGSHPARENILDPRFGRFAGAFFSHADIAVGPLE